MSEGFSVLDSYHHALERHHDFTKAVAAAGAFSEIEPCEDEIDLRRLVRLFLGCHTGTDALQSRRLSEDIVPYIDQYRIACENGNLAGVIAPQLSSRALMHYGLRNDFVHFDRLYVAYRSTLDVLPNPALMTAERGFQRQIRADTAMHSDRLLMIGASEESRSMYSRVLRRLGSRGLISDELYQKRLHEAGIQPPHKIVRMLRSE